MLKTSKLLLVRIVISKIFLVRILVFVRILVLVTILVKNFCLGKNSCQEFLFLVRILVLIARTIGKNLFSGPIESNSNVKQE